MPANKIGIDNGNRVNEAFSMTILGHPKPDTLCDTLVLGVPRAYKDLGSHRGLVSC